MSDIPTPQTEADRKELIKQLQVLLAWCDTITETIKQLIKLDKKTIDREFNKFNDGVIKILDPLVPQFGSPSITKRWKEFVEF